MAMTVPSTSGPSYTDTSQVSPGRHAAPVRTSASRRRSVSAWWIGHKQILATLSGTFSCEDQYPTPLQDWSGERLARRVPSSGTGAHRSRETNRSGIGSTARVPTARRIPGASWRVARGPTHEPKASADSDSRRCSGRSPSPRSLHRSVRARRIGTAATRYCPA